MADPGYFWRKIQRVKADYDVLDPHPGVLPSEFRQWLLAEYGIQLIPARDGFNLSNTYEIVDEQKYLVFELKYT
jgi:hypothetical protein